MGGDLQTVSSNRSVFRLCVQANPIFLRSFQHSAKAIGNLKFESDSKLDLKSWGFGVYRSLKRGRLRIAFIFST
jgi:hypothetical protein